MPDHAKVPCPKCGEPAVLHGARADYPYLLTEGPASVPIRTFRHVKEHGARCELCGTLFAPVVIWAEWAPWTPEAKRRREERDRRPPPPPPPWWRRYGFTIYIVAAWLLIVGAVLVGWHLSNA